MTSLHIETTVERKDFQLSVFADLPLDGITAVFGPSGAGKSTLLRALAGFERARGTIQFGSEFWCAPGVFVPPHRRRVGYVFQDARLFGHLDVAGNLAFAARRARVAVNVSEVVALLDLSALLERHPATLSGGEAQRVALARALLSAPRLLLMDEPFAALDATRRAEILPYVERLRDDANLPIIYVSHSFAEVARLATVVLCLRDGKVDAVGPASEILPVLAGNLPGDEMATVIDAVVRARTPDGLTELHFAGGTILTPEAVGTLGDTVRLAVRARDVMLANTRPQGLSALNILSASVLSIEFDGPFALVRMNVGPTPLVARITRRSVSAIGLQPGGDCFAILKSVALVRS